MSFKRIATLNVQTIYASDGKEKFAWKSFVKEANKEPNKEFQLPKIAYQYDTDHFLYLTARMISGMEKWGHNGNYDAFPWEEIKKAANTAIGKGFYIEHKEDSEEDAKGIILDVFPNDEEQYLVALCCIDKEEFPEFIQQLLDGTYNQVSMSCLANECECSLCGNVAHSFDELCEHMNSNLPMLYLKGKKDDKGNDIYEINRDICFTGLSSVAVPADKDAFVFDIKAAKKKQSKIKEELAIYHRSVQAGKMKEFKMACEEQFKALDTVSLLNKLQNCATAITNQVVDQQAGTEIINGPLQGILRQLMELQIGLTVLDLNKLTPSVDNTLAVKGEPETEVAEVTTNAEEKDGEGHLLTEDDSDVVNLDKEIDSMLEEPTKGISKLLKNKYFKNEDELESIIKSYMVGAEVLDSDSDGIIVKVLEEDGKHTYKIYLLGNSGPSEAIKVERVEELDSQEANFDKEIESYDNWSYTPFSSTASSNKQAIIDALNKSGIAGSISSHGNISNNNYKVYEDNDGNLIVTVYTRGKNIAENIISLVEPFGYKAIKEDNDILETTVTFEKQSFSSTAKQENKMIKVIKSGTWAIPETQREVEDLQELLLNPIKAEEAEDLIYDLVGDDDLFDAIDAQIEKNPETDVRPIIIDRLRELLDPEEYEQSMNEEIHKMLVDLVNK